MTASHSATIGMTPFGAGYTPISLRPHPPRAFVPIQFLFLYNPVIQLLFHFIQLRFRTKLPCTTITTPTPSHY